MRLILLELVIAIFCYACTSPTQKPIKGGVYIAKELFSNREVDYSHVYPLLALRIDSINYDTLLVKYRFGKEAHLDEDFIYRDSCNCYKSSNKVAFAPLGQLRHIVFLNVKNDGALELYYIQSGEKRYHQFRLSYIDSVDLDTHRNIYYAEDGFELFVE
ncbi:MAG: hypothetical protein WD077_14640 [Bacteroidia bacterium]